MAGIYFSQKLFTTWVKVSGGFFIGGVFYTMHVW